MARGSVPLLLLITVGMLARPAAAFAEEPADVASYALEARLDSATRRVEGRGTITYRNPSPDVLQEVWLKLYLNAFRSADTVWAREARAQGIARLDEQHPGWIQLHTLQLLPGGVDVLPPDAAQAETVLRVPLPAPLQPGETVQLAVEWTSQLPRIVARTGFAEVRLAGEETIFVMAGQWYPKLAVYDRGAWDSEPWHASAEFFADVGSYTVDLTVPRGYVIGATGVRQQESEQPGGALTVRYRAERVTDFAWTAWPGFRTSERSIRIGERQVQVELLAAPGLAGEEDRYFMAAEGALRLFSGWFGDYPWDRLALVVPPAEAAEAGGMEYPMLATLEKPARLPLGLGRRVFTPEIVTVHEIAHQWVPLQVATDEGREAWLDEGFAEYATIKALGALLGPDRSVVDLGPLRLGYESIHRLQFTLGAPREPLVQPAWAFPSFLTYGATVYSKGALFLLSLERSLGEDRFLEGMWRYVERWRWRHPRTDDLRDALREVAGEEVDRLFAALAFGSGVVEYRAVEVAARRAVVERRGEVAFPVEIRVTDVDGHEERRRWDGIDPRLEIEASGADLARLEVDPDRRVPIALNPLDDAAQARWSARPVALATGRVLAGVGLLLQLLGLLG